MNNENINNIFQSLDWIFAKTMPETPHFYTLREKWDDDDLFVECVKFIRETGDTQTFKGRKYKYLNLNGYQYWTMGAPLDKTILINKCAINYETGYADISEIYDGTFDDESFIEEDNQLKQILKEYIKGDVLDIGCGTGKLLEMFHVEQYIGIDKCQKMIERLNSKFKAKTIRTSFEHFDGYKFDSIISLYGSVSYIDEPLEKIKSLLKPNGKAFLMFYADDYNPITHQIGVKDKIFLNNYAGFEFSNYKIVTI